MTLELNLTLELKDRVEKEAARLGISVDALTEKLFNEMFEDREDAADAQDIIHKTNPDEWRSLDELRKVVRV